jgi:aspartate/methionine/tyrosine aminotransferase
MPLVEARGFSFDLATFEKALSPKTKLVILNSPANPTGGVIAKDDLKRIADLVRDRDLVVLSDEIYSRIFYDEAPESITQFEGMLEKTVILDGFSKTYSMTGWRLGYGIMPAPMAQVVAKLQTNATSCTATFSQLAAVDALRGDQGSVDRMVEEFRRRRDAIVEGLRTMPGFSCARPKGAFYVFPNIARTGYSARALADKLLEEAGVACLSGTAFGEFGEGHLRFSYANSMENIQEALRRIRGVVAK